VADEFDAIEKFVARTTTILANAEQLQTATPEGLKPCPQCHGSGYLVDRGEYWKTLIHNPKE
jgi:hypothetical protein